MHLNEQSNVPYGKLCCKMSEGKKHGSYTDCQFESLPLNDIDNFLTVIKTECKLKIKSKWYSFKLKWLKKKHMEITQLIFQIL